MRDIRQKVKVEDVQRKVSCETCLRNKQSSHSHLHSLSNLLKLRSPPHLNPPKSFPGDHPHCNPPSYLRTLRSYDPDACSPSPSLSFILLPSPSFSFSFPPVLARSLSLSRAASPAHPQVIPSEISSTHSHLCSVWAHLLLISTKSQTTSPSSQLTLTSSHPDLSSHQDPFTLRSPNPRLNSA